jgi:hypothetical protein
MMNSLETSLQKLTDDELIRMVYVVPDDYTVEGIECAKSILEARGVKHDESMLSEQISEVYDNEVTEILKPKEGNALQEIFSLEKLIWGCRAFPVIFIWKSRGEISELFSVQSFITFWGVWAVILFALEWLLKKKKLKDVKMAGESIKKLKSKIET